ncbi:MAG TPA: DsbA family oxidoreductase [Macromonas sp.]|nr:DsbA family oxidoreductase [Macromonas sp.]
MTSTLRIDFVADITCPWCALGLEALMQALERLAPRLQADVLVQPFELHPTLEAGGCDLAEYLAERYGATPEQQAQTRAVLQQRGAELGFSFHAAEGARLYNTFNAHRLLRWAAQAHPERQMALLRALLVAYHQEAQPLEADDVLLDAVEAVGLDRENGIEILASNAFADEVREQQAALLQAGIRSVPTLIVNDRFVLSGARSPEALEQALQQMAAESAD